MSVAGIYKSCSDTGDGTLTPKFRRIAEEELGETDHRRREAVDNLKLLLDEDPDLYPRVDDEFLLRFIRVRKYDVEGALRTMKHYYRNRATCAGIYGSAVPSNVKPGARKLFMVLPERDVHGCLVLFCKPGVWDPNEVTYNEFQHASMLCLDQMAMDPSSQTAGISVMLDYDGFTFDKVFAVSYSVLRRAVEYFQDCLPIRVKGVHVVKQPYAFDMLYAIMRPFMKQKMSDKFRFHGHTFEALHEHLPPSILPEEYGGEASPLDFEAFWSKMDDAEELFQENARHGYHDAITTRVVTAL